MFEEGKRAGYLHGSARLSTERKGKPRKQPVWIMSYRLPNGKASKKVLGPAWTRRGRPQEGYFTQATAETAVRQFLVEHQDLSVAGRLFTFGQAAEQWLAACEQKVERGELRASTLRNYRTTARRVFNAWTTCGRPSWEQRPLDEIDRAEVEALRDHLVARGLSSSTLNKHRTVLRGIFDLAVKRHGLAHNPGLAFEWSSTRAARSGQFNFYRPDEVEALANHAANQQDRAMFLTAAYTGLRLSELRALRWRTVDLEDKLIHVERGYTSEGGMQLPKSYKSRSVPMISRVATALVALRQREHFTADDDLVFINTVGNPVGGDKLHRRFKAAIKRAGLRDLRFHDLRHSFATMAVREYPITDVQRWMGHADLSMTQQYIRFAPQPDAAKKLGALVDQAVTPRPLLRAA